MGDNEMQQRSAKATPNDVAQPDDDASSDGDRSWTDDPITVDPDEDRSVDAVIARTDQKRRATQQGQREDDSDSSSSASSSSASASTDS